MDRIEKKADFRNANLSGANLIGANISGVDFTDEIKTGYIGCP